MKKMIWLIALISLGMTALAQDKAPVTLENVMQEYAYYPQTVRGLRSMNDGEHYTTLEKQGKRIVQYAYRTGDREAVLFDLNKTPIPGVNGVSGYTFSSDEQNILLRTHVEPIYRRSFTAEYFVYDREEGAVGPLSENGRQEIATFSPNGNKVAFVRDNNIYVKDLDTGDEHAITTDGKRNAIINGKPDWVYEEEFEFNKAFAWSPDGQRIAYIRFDESRVKEWTIQLYKGMAPEKEANALYPENYTYKYPKAGEDNSLVGVHIYSLESGKTTQVDVGQETDQYIPRIKWTHDPEKLLVYRLNRLQNHLEFLRADAKTGQTEGVYEATNDYYIDEKYFDQIAFLPGGEEFIFMSERDGYAHLYRFSMENDEVQPVTHGDFDVTDFLGFDPHGKKVYYQAAAQSPLQREVYAMPLGGKKARRLTPKEGTNRAEFSDGFKYFINYFSAADTPTEVSLHNQKGREIRVLEDNAKLKKRLEKTAWSPKEFFTFETAQGISLNGWMIKPVGFDPGKEYPVLMTQYSGPNSQEVRDRWEFGWEQVLANKGYVVACVDGRGTGARGEAFRKQTYQELGKLETTDQIEAAKYMGNKGFVDASRIGIFGWSYGGFMSLLCMTKGADYFDTGVAVAPVTNWRYYDNIYTERFMRTPQENPDGYDDNSPINHAEKLEGDLLILHGTADDNVHIQNSHEMAEALVQAGKDFTFQPYTNRDHGIYGGNTRMHLFGKVIKFLGENLE